MARRPTGQVIERPGKEGRRTFAIRYRAPGHGRVFETLGSTPEWDRRKAEAELEVRLAQIKAGVWEPPRQPEPVATTEENVPTFWAFAEDWYRRHAIEVGERTREHWLWALDGHLRGAFGRYRLDEITAEQVDSYRADKLAAGLSGESVNKTLRLLARILAEAEKYGHVSRNVARGDGSRARVKRPKRHWLELDDVRSLLAAAGDYRRELMTLVFTGLRISELGNLRWRAVDLEHGRIVVEESKTEAGEGRAIDLPPDLLDELKRHFAENPRAGLDALVFPTSHGRPRDRSNSRGRLGTVLKRANKAREKQELPPIAALTNHTLRRTFASLMYEAGAQPTDVMAAMGHKSAKLALEVYAKKMTRKRDTAERMHALVLGTDWAQEANEGSPALPSEETGRPQMQGFPSGR